MSFLSSCTLNTIGLCFDLFHLIDKVQNLQHSIHTHSKSKGVLWKRLQPSVKIWNILKQYNKVQGILQTQISEVGKWVGTVFKGSLDLASVSGLPQMCTHRSVHRQAMLCNTTTHWTHNLEPHNKSNMSAPCRLLRVHRCDALSIQLVRIQIACTASFYTKNPQG